MLWGKVGGEVLETFARDSTWFHNGKVKSEQVSRDDQRSDNPYKWESGWVFVYLMLA
ncbi:hypothetical protein [Nostoc sp. DedSLP04]|uniref:hypothetical protein n=1 Tax=Nostoc sp. DedSLP04 TaxID=3075401 RepID=UPI002AD433E0|nr:hypothetical protein [Nostoc sp. DedSLP04]